MERKPKITSLTIYHRKSSLLKSPTFPSVWLFSARSLSSSSLPRRSSGTASRTTSPNGLYSTSMLCAPLLLLQLLVLLSLFPLLDHSWVSLVPSASPSLD
uniref:Uncharacterized protein n=1 Tax=Cacopsylla melanoneura TaxID=428564 RepID=A0A8D9BBP6_9HEMI